MHEISSVTPFLSNLAYQAIEIETMEEQRLTNTGSQKATNPSKEIQSRQLVRFTFYSLDPMWYHLPEAVRQQGKRELISIYARQAGNTMLRSYSLYGLRSDCDLMLWNATQSIHDLQAISSYIRCSMLGSYLHESHAFLSMTKRSSYVGKNPKGVQDPRLVLHPADKKYLFVYPFVKTRAWYRLPMEERIRMMREHIQVGLEYPSVILHTTYSFGLDDQEFVVAFETDEVSDFLDLVQALRETEASSYTLRDTPMFSCAAQPFDDILDAIGI
jgi:chlorite dismutase